jgi:hypothetical protein
MRWGWAAALMMVGTACLPNPQSVKERREQFPRDDLRDDGLILAAPPSDMKPVGAVFGRAIQLLGYTVSNERPKGGELVEVTFYWSAVGLVEEEYQVFLHGDAIEGQAPRIHGDHFPAKGRYPSDVWQAGEVVVDAFSIRIPVSYGARRLGLYTGLYKENYRVPLTENGQRPGSSDNRSLAVELTFE